MGDKRLKKVLLPWESKAYLLIITEMLVKTKRDFLFVCAYELENGKQQQMSQSGTQHCQRKKGVSEHNHMERYSRSCHRCHHQLKLLEA